MTDKQPIFYNFPPYLQILTFALFVITSLILVILIGVLIALPFFGGNILDIADMQGNYNDPAVISMMKYFQVISQIGLFLIPPIVFAFLVNRDIRGYLYLKKLPFGIAIIIGTAALVASTPIVGWLAEINNKLNLPDSWSGLENWMQESEASARELTEAFMNNTSIGSFVINLLMIAIIPAVGEELFFRGVVLRLFREWTKNVHVAVLISAILFSAFHMQFYGFLPRLFLGMFLGYLFVWSGNLWIPVIIHFINNGFAVVYMYISNLENRPADLESVATFDNLILVVVSLFVFLMFMVSFWFYHRRKAEVTG